MDSPRKMRPYDISEDTLNSPDVAVVGAAARFPGSSDVPAFWNNLTQGRECIRRLSNDDLRSAGVDEATLADPDYVKVSGVLEGLELFDAQFFGFSKREASVLDPQHRHFLEVCWEALESAGILPEAFGRPIGVFGGSGMNAYMPYNLFTNPELMRQMGLFLVRHTGNDKDFLTTRVSYCLDLHGPSVNVQTACSTSLVAIHLACQSLLAGECDAALAGGVTIELPHYRGYHYQEGEILSPDGHCRPFSAMSKGTVLTSGAGVVVLKRLRDAVEAGDFIHAVIKGSAVNNDGARKVGYLAPSVDGQAACIVEALQVAGIEAREISYVECHGTGTYVGDPIEVTALAQAFSRSTEERGFCGIGSVKSNIGHLDTAAGVASFIKLTEMLRHEQLVPTLHFERPNPEIPFEQSPFYVVGSAKPWPRTSTPRRAGVSSLGVGGTNAHVIVEEAPRRLPARSERHDHALVLSARSQASLDRAARALAAHLEREPELDLGEVASTLLLGRRRFSHCRVLSARTTEEARPLLTEPDGKRVFDVVGTSDPMEVAFLFPGGGAQYPNMARDVYESEPVFRDRLDECLGVAEKLGLAVREVLFPKAGGEEGAARELAKRMSLGFPAVVAVELAYAALLESWGVRPVAMLGHSLGEYAAAHLAGVFSLEDAFRVVCCRGRLMEKVEAGGMLSVPMSATKLLPLLGGRLALAAVNGPEMCVVSGPNAELDGLAVELSKRDIDTRRLHIDVAAHSALLDPILAEFEHELSSIRFGQPKAPYLSNLTGAFADPGEVTTPKYFVRHLRNTVRFSECLDALTAAHPNAILLEVGPGQALSSVARAHASRQKARASLSVSPHPKDKISEAAHIATVMGRLHASGANVDWQAFMHGEPRRIVPLPATPFEHERHWVEAGKGYFQAIDSESAIVREADIGRWFFAPAFRETKLAESNAPAAEVWYVLVDPGGLRDAIAFELRARGVLPVFVAPGNETKRFLDGSHTLSLAEPAAYEELVRALVAEHGAPNRILHALCLTTAPENGHAPLSASVDRAFFSLLHLAQALGQEDLKSNTELLVATRGVFDAAGTQTEHPSLALAQGPVLVIPKEIPEIRARLFDLGETRDPAAVARTLANELSAPSEHSLVAQRGATRYAEVLERTSLANDDYPPLPESPVFFFTGGLGGMALTLAHDAVEKLGARLVLLSRTGLPTDSANDEAPRSIDPVEAERIALVASLRAAGADVLVLEADVTSAQEMRAAVARAHEHFGHIDVVVHAAGIVDDGVLTLKSRESARAVLAPKVEGVEALVQALEDSPPSTLVLVSSTSAFLGAPGQIDYTAANAYVNARTRHLAACLANTRIVSLGYGVWRETGMAVRAKTKVPRNKPGPFAGHPLLGTVQSLETEKAEFHALYRVADLWPLDEHRVRGRGAILPGTAVVELVRAVGARALSLGEEAPLEIRNLTLLAALEVGDGDAREVSIHAAREGDGPEAPFEVTIESRGEGEAEFTQHARAIVARCGQSTAREPPISDILGRCRARHIEFDEGRQTLPQERELAFGPQWNVIRSMDFGELEAFARLELPERFTPTLRTWKLHPGLLDMASGFAFSLADVGGTNDQIRVPISYERVRVYGALTPKITAYARCRQADPQTGVAVFDVRIAAEQGRMLVEVNGYVTRSIAPSDFRRPATPAEAPTLLDRWLESGITKEEGAAAFRRALHSGSGSTLYTTPIAPYALLEQLLPKPKATTAPATVSSTEDSSPANADAPRDDIERELCAIWQSLLGVERLGIRDNFFDLGGHSLIAVRLFSKVKKTFGVELSLAILFEAPTVEATARIIRDALGIEFSPLSRGAPHGGAPSANGSAPRSIAPRFSPLVTIQHGKKGGLPFFCVHGAGGNVLNFRDLSRGLGAEQTFYGLQAQGVDGAKPLETIEAMAELYLSAMRRAQPHGPYLLGGYSGGGVVAYEMAQQLHRSGEHIALLVFLDTFHPATRPRRIPMSTRVQELIHEGPSYIPRRMKNTISRRLKERSEERQLRFYERASLPLPLELRDLQLTRAFLEAAQRYEPTRYPGRVTLFRATQVASVYAHVGPRLGWDDLTPNMKIVEVPGDHDSLVLEPNVLILTGHLRDALQEAAAQALAPTWQGVAAEA